MTRVRDLVTQKGTLEVNDSMNRNVKKDTEEVLGTVVRETESAYSRLYQQTKRLRDDIESIRATICEIQESLT